MNKAVLKAATVALWAMALWLAALPASSSAAATGDLTIETSSNLVGQFAGQTFTVPASPATDTLLHTIKVGEVTRVAGEPLQVAVAEMSGDSPGPPLFESPMISVPFGPATLTVHPNILVQPGHVYVFYIEAAGVIFGLSGNRYAGGELILDNSGFWQPKENDISFRAETSDGRYATDTSLSCPASVKVGENVACVVTVATAGGGGVTPTGTVGLDSSGGGSLTPSSCTLGAEGKCSVVYSPAPGESGVDTVSVHYAAGDATHLGSQDSNHIAVTRRSTALNHTEGCHPVEVKVGQAITCAVTVTDDDPVGPKVDPGGFVVWKTSNTGNFAAGGTCPILPTGALGASSCRTMTYTPLVPGTHFLSSGYPGDGVHFGSGPVTQTALLAQKRDTAAKLDCLPGIVGRTTTCTVNVDDITEGIKTTPTGPIEFVSAKRGLFGSGGRCGLVNGTCSVTFRPAVPGPNTIAIIYDGDPLHESTGERDALAVRASCVKRKRKGHGKKRRGKKRAAFAKRRC